MDWAALSVSMPLLAALPESARSHARQRRLDAGTVLFRRGQRPSMMHVVVSGEIRLVRHSSDGGQIVLQRARHGFLAEASLDQPAYHCDAVVADLSDVVAIPIGAFRQALDDDAFRAAWIRHLASELRRVRALAERVNLRTARDRIVHFIATEGDDGRIMLTQSRKDWAAELGLTHEALYRELARMRRSGEMVVTGNELRLTDRTLG